VKRQKRFIPGIPFRLENLREKIQNDYSHPPFKREYPPAKLKEKLAGRYKCTVGQITRILNTMELALALSAKSEMLDPYKEEYESSKQIEEAAKKIRLGWRNKKQRRKS
jgi:hypothetical protein